MSANTKIVVLRRKELLYTGIFAALGVLFLILLLMLLLPEKEPDIPEDVSSGAVADVSAETVSADAANTMTAEDGNDAFAPVRMGISNIWE